jgi:Dolichyl-phosphate-mannose-protein mannosyltransferase
LPAHCKLPRIRKVADAAPLAVAVLAGVMFGVALGYGSHAASASDPYGYVSQARLLRHGTLHQPEPLTRIASWPDAALSLAPLGYRPAPHGFANVPTYPPGLPLLMALASLVAGACGVYLVVPLSAAVLIAAVYRLARRVTDPLAAAGAAVLTATCPAFLFMAMWPMSDVPVTAFWIASFASASSIERRGRPVLTSILTAIAVLIRPNLAPLAAVPIALSLFSSRTPQGKGLLSAALRAAIGFLPVVIAIPVLNAALYGSPFESGYGAVSGLYSIDRVARNAGLHAHWLWESQGWYLLAAIVGLVVHLRRGFTSVMTWCAIFAALVWIAYLPYHSYREWWYLRFLLPALPILFVFAVDGVAAVTARFGPAVRAGVTTLFVIAAAAHGTWFAVHNGVFEIAADEWRYVETGAYVASALPQDAVVIAGQHSGSIRHYSGRDTIRYDRMRPDALDAAVAVLAAASRPVYIVLDAQEEPAFRAHFGGQRTVERLGGPPAAALDTRIPVHVFGLPGAPAVPPAIPHVSGGFCREPEP